MRNRILSLMLILILPLNTMMLSSCSDLFAENEMREARRLYNYLKEEDCLGTLNLWKTIGSNDNVELCFEGECNLQDVFLITKKANCFLKSHPNSDILTKKYGLRITFFPAHPHERDYENMDFYASVAKYPNEDEINYLFYNSTEKIYTSSFRDCPVSYKRVEVSFNIVFDDFEALNTIPALRNFAICSDHVRTDEETMIRVLNSLCYYEDHGIEMNYEFAFIIQEDLRDAYNRFVSAHKGYKVFRTM